MNSRPKTNRFYLKVSKANPKKYGRNFCVEWRKIELAKNRNSGAYKYVCRSSELEGLSDIK